MKPDQKGNFGVLAIFTVILLVALTGASVYFWQNYEKEKALKTVEVKTEEKTEEKTETPTPAPTPTPAEESKAPVVVFTPNGLFTAEERAELQTKFINPFLDWNKEINQVTVSIEIEKPYPAIAGYKYKVGYINEGGGNGGFLYGTSTPLEWWLPECLGGCNFSAEFKAKYPEIAAQVD